MGKETEKLCPIMSRPLAHQLQDGRQREVMYRAKCVGEKCALWSGARTQEGQIEYGCGLINHPADSMGLITP